MKKITLFMFVIILTISCSETAQYGHMRAAMDKLGKCNFIGALEASNNAIAFGKTNEKNYMASLFIKAKSHEQLNQLKESEKTYSTIVENSKIKTIANAKVVANNFNPLISSCNKKI